MIDLLLPFLQSPHRQRTGELAAQYFPSEVVFSPSVSPLFSQLTSSLAVRALQKRQQKIDHPAS